jgi:hypothetical protein
MSDKSNDVRVNNGDKIAYWIATTGTIILVALGIVVAGIFLFK